MNSRNPFKALVASLTVFVFFITSLGMNPNAFAAATTLPLGEVSLPYHAAFDRGLSLALPSELGKLEYFKPGKGPMLVHIQTAHGHYEAQQQIRKILHHVADQYGIKTLLLEGSASELSPGFLNFFPKDRKLTQKIADVFTKHALVTGEELFLLDGAQKKKEELVPRTSGFVKANNPNQSRVPSPEFRAFGIENLESYLANGASFAAALSEKQKTGRFLKTFDEGVRRLSAPYLSSDLRGFLDNLKSFESKLMGFTAWLEFLKTNAKKHLRLDLTSARHQIEWPMLLRVFKTQEFAAKMDRQKLPKERDAFLKALKRFVAPTVYAEIENLLRREDQSVQLPDPETSLLVEEMVRQLPRDFNYDAFPNIRASIGIMLLQSELKADVLRREVEALSDRLAAKLARTSEEKALVDLFKDYRLLEKLFALELTPAEYGTTLERKAALLPSKLAERFLQVNSLRRVRDISFEHLSEIDSLFEKSLKFYEGAKARDTEMMQGVECRLKETGADRAVIITGGFHADPFREHFAAGDYGYALISPRITSSDDAGKSDYVQFVMNSFAKTSTYAMSMQGAATDHHLSPAVTRHAVKVVQSALRLTAEQLAALGDSLNGSPEAEREEWQRFQEQSPESRSESRAGKEAEAPSVPMASASELDGLLVPDRFMEVLKTNPEFEYLNGFDDHEVYRPEQAALWLDSGLALVFRRMSRSHFYTDHGPVSPFHFILQVESKPSQPEGFQIEQDPGRDLRMGVSVSVGKKPAIGVSHLRDIAILGFQYPQKNHIVVFAAEETVRDVMEKFHRTDFTVGEVKKEPVVVEWKAVPEAFWDSKQGKAILLSHAATRGNVVLSEAKLGPVQFKDSKGLPDSGFLQQLETAWNESSQGKVRTDLFVSLGELFWKIRKVVSPGNDWQMAERKKQLLAGVPEDALYRWLAMKVAKDGPKKMGWIRHEIHDEYRSEEAKMFLYGFLMGLLTEEVRQTLRSPEIPSDKAPRSESRRRMSEKEQGIVRDFWAYLRERGLEPTIGDAGFVGVKKAGANYTGDAVEPYINEICDVFDLKFDPDMQVSIMWADFSADGPRGEVIQQWLADAYAAQFGSSRSESRIRFLRAVLSAAMAVFTDPASIPIVVRALPVVSLLGAVAGCVTWNASSASSIKPITTKVHGRQVVVSVETEPTYLHTSIVVKTPRGNFIGGGSIETPGYAEPFKMSISLRGLLVVTYDVDHEWVYRPESALAFYGGGQPRGARGRFSHTENVDLSQLVPNIPDSEWKLLDRIMAKAPNRRGRWPISLDEAMKLLPQAKRMVDLRGDFSVDIHRNFKYYWASDISDLLANEYWTIEPPKSVSAAVSAQGRGSSSSLRTSELKKTASRSESRAAADFARSLLVRLGEHKTGNFLVTAKVGPEMQLMQSAVVVGIPGIFQFEGVGSEAVTKWSIPSDAVGNFQQILISVLRSSGVETAKETQLRSESRQTAQDGSSQDVFSVMLGLQKPQRAEGLANGISAILKEILPGTLAKVKLRLLAEQQDQKEKKWLELTLGEPQVIPVGKRGIGAGKYEDVSAEVTLVSADKKTGMAELSVKRLYAPFREILNKPEDRMLVSGPRSESREFGVSDVEQWNATLRERKLDFPRDAFPVTVSLDMNGGIKLTASLDASQRDQASVRKAVDYLANVSRQIVARGFSFEIDPTHGAVGMFHKLENHGSAVSIRLKKRAGMDYASSILDADAARIADGLRSYGDGLVESVPTGDPVGNAADLRTVIEHIVALLANGQEAEALPFLKDVRDGMPRFDAFRGELDAYIKILSARSESRTGTGMALSRRSLLALGSAALMGTASFVFAGIFDSLEDEILASRLGYFERTSWLHSDKVPTREDALTDLKSISNAHLGTFHNAIRNLVVKSHYGESQDILVRALEVTGDSEAINVLRAVDSQFLTKEKMEALNASDRAVALVGLRRVAAALGDVKKVDWALTLLNDAKDAYGRPLNQSEFEEISATGNVQTMKLFINRYVEEVMGKRVMDDAGLNGFAPWYVKSVEGVRDPSDGAVGNRQPDKDFNFMVHELGQASWISRSETREEQGFSFVRATVAPVRKSLESLRDGTAEGFGQLSRGDRENIQSAALIRLGFLDEDLSMRHVDEGRQLLQMYLALVAESWSAHPLSAARDESPRKFQRSESRTREDAVSGEGKTARAVADYLNAHMTPKFRQAYRHGVRIVESSVVLSRHDGQGVSFDLSPSADLDYELQMLAEASGIEFAELKNVISKPVTRSESRQRHLPDFAKSLPAVANDPTLTPNVKAFFAYCEAQGFEVSINPDAGFIDVWGASFEAVYAHAGEFRKFGLEYDDGYQWLAGKNLCSFSDQRGEIEKHFWHLISAARSESRTSEIAATFQENGLNYDYFDRLIETITPDTVSNVVEDSWKRSSYSVTFRSLVKLGEGKLAVRAMVHKVANAGDETIQVILYGARPGDEMARFEFDKDQGLLSSEFPQLVARPQLAKSLKVAFDTHKVYEKSLLRSESRGIVHFMTEWMSEGELLTVRGLYYESVRAKHLGGVKDDRLAVVRKAYNDLRAGKYPGLPAADLLVATIDEDDGIVAIDQAIRAYQPRAAKASSLRSESRLLQKDIASLGLGTIWYGRNWPWNVPGYSYPSADEVENHLAKMIGRVATPEKKLMIDTAANYGTSEKRIGDFFKKHPELRSKALIATKWGIESEDAWPNTSVVDAAAAPAQYLEDSLSRSVRNLGSVDLLYLHNASLDQLRDPRYRDAMLDAKKRGAGRLRFVGVTLRTTVTPEVEAAFVQAMEEGLYDWCDAVQLPPKILSGHRDLVANLYQKGVAIFINSPVLKREEGTDFRTAVQLLLKDPLVTSVLTGSRTHLDETIGYHEELTRLEFQSLQEFYDHLSGAGEDVFSGVTTIEIVNAASAPVMLDKLAGVLTFESPSGMIDPQGKRHDVGHVRNVRGIRFHPRERIFTAELGNSEPSINFWFHDSVGLWLVHRSGRIPAQENRSELRHVAFARTRLMPHDATVEQFLKANVASFGIEWGEITSGKFSVFLTLVPDEKKYAVSDPSAMDVELVRAGVRSLDDVEEIQLFELAPAEEEVPSDETTAFERRDTLGEGTPAWSEHPSIRPQHSVEFGSYPLASLPAFFEITPQKLADSPKWIALGLGVLGLGIFAYLAVSAIKHIVHKRKSDVSDKAREEQSAGIEEDHDGTGNTSRVDYGDRPEPRSESRGMQRALTSFTFAVWLLFSELAFAQGAAQLAKDLQFGMNSKKMQAMEEIVKRLTPEEGEAPDAEVLMKQDEIVKLLLAMVKNPFGGELSAKAVSPLAAFAKRDPALVDLLVQELKKGTPTTKLQVIRTLAAVGAPAKDAATPDLKALLKDPKLGNDAAIALALFGGPFAAEDVSFIIKGMMQVKDADVQLKVALRIIDIPGAQKLYAKELEFVLLRGFNRLVLKSQVDPDLLRALAKLNTPGSVQAVFSIIESRGKYGYQDRVLAVEAFASSPSPQVLSFLLKTFSSETGGSVLGAIAKVFGGYGVAAESTLPVLESYLEKLPLKKNLLRGEQEKGYISGCIKAAIKQIENAKQEAKILVAPGTNNPPQQVPQGTKRSESRGTSPDEDMSIDGPLDVAERAANEMDAAMALQMERSLGHVEVADVAGDPQAASDAMDQVMAAQLERFKDAERAVRGQDRTPRLLIVAPGAKGPASSFVMAEARFFPIEKVWIETKDGRVLGYSPVKPGDFRDALKKRFEERGIADDLSVIARVQLDMKSPFRSETRRDQPSPRREKWIREHARVIAELEGLDRDRSKVVLEPATPERAERLNHLEEAYAALNWRRIQLEEYLRRSRLANSPVVSGAVALGTAAVKSPEFSSFVTVFILTAGLQARSTKKVAVPFDPDDELALILGDIQKMAHGLAKLPLFSVGELFHPELADQRGRASFGKRSESREHPFMRPSKQTPVKAEGLDPASRIPREKKPLHVQVQNPPLAGHLVNRSSALAGNFLGAYNAQRRSELRYVGDLPELVEDHLISIFFDPDAAALGKSPWVVEVDGDAHFELTPAIIAAAQAFIAKATVPEVTVSVTLPSGQRKPVPPVSISPARARSENPLTPVVSRSVNPVLPVSSARNIHSENPGKASTASDQPAHAKVGKPEVPNGDFDFKDVMIRTLIEGVSVEKPLEKIENKALPEQIQLAVRAKVKTAGRVEHYSAAEHAIKVDRKAGWVVFSLGTAKDESMTVLLSLKSNAGKVIAGDAVVANSQPKEAGSERYDKLMKQWEAGGASAQDAIAKAAQEKNKKILLGNGTISKRQADKRTGGLIDKVLASPNERERAKIAWQDLEDSSLGHLISSGLAADLLKILRSAKRIQAIRSWGLGITLTVFAVAIATAGVLAGFMAPVTITLAVLASVVLLVEMGVFNAMKPEVLEMVQGNDVFLLIPLLERVVLDLEMNGSASAKKGPEAEVKPGESTTAMARAFAEADAAFGQKKAKAGVVVMNLSAKIAGVDPDLNGNGKTVSAVKPMGAIAGKPPVGASPSSVIPAAPRSESRTGEWNSISVEQRVGELLAEFTGRTLDPLDTLEELGMDSLDMNDLIATLKDVFGLSAESLRSRITDMDNQHTLAQSILEILEAERVPSELRQEKKVWVPTEATAEALLTPERLVLIREYYGNLVPGWLLRKLLEKQVFPEGQAKLEAWLGMPVTEVTETEALQQLIPGGHKLLARSLPVDTTRADASSQISVNVRNVVTVGGSVAIESGLLERLLSENPRALFYLLKGFLGNTEGPALVTVGTPDLAKKIIREITAKRVVDASEKESLDAITAALAEPANKLLRIETLAEGETEAAALNRFTAVNQGGVVSLHLNGAMLASLQGGYHFMFAEEIGTEDLLVASVLGSALKSVADLIRNIPDEKLRGDLLTEFVQEHLPGITKNGDVFVINQLAKLAEAFVQQALIAKSA